MKKKIKNSSIINQVIVLSEKYPNLNEIVIDYNGSGDSFNCMYSNVDGVDESDYENLVFDMFDIIGETFVNDGAEGEITINLKNKTVSIKNYWISTTLNLEQDVTIE